MDGPAGYKGKALEFLRAAGAGIGDVIEVSTDWGKVTGTLVPRYLSADDSHIVLKLKSGYNVGLKTSGLSRPKVVAKGEMPSFSVPDRTNTRAGVPRVLLLGTGGTIASRVDYRTGAVHPAVGSADLYALVPELSEIADVEPEILFNVFSENIEPPHWSKLAVRVAKAVSQGYRGVVVTHGTDTLGYTAAALSFALSGIPIPVVLTAAQRSSDRPSSDAPLNLVGSVSVAAQAGFSGVYVAMHHSESDEDIGVHRGPRVRKNHTSRRDAFVSVGVPLAAVWNRRGIHEVGPDLPRRGTAKQFAAKPKFDGNVALLKFYPGMPSSLVVALKRLKMRGLVIEGTGLGHISSGDISAVRGFVKAGGMVCVTSQCINGRVDLNVYDTGRDLAGAGALPLEDMLPETALVKAMWALANTGSVAEAKKVMVTDLVGEMTRRRLPG